uniref:Kinesin-like protein n=1 Tax=Chlamydomonas euryale TaxID=1486919 RepID=A0A7R9YS33_9CHLO|mmetsp:Transcript_16349/g.48712  ORF Transcript_16349/g.48712 Transcript_16349/m.48712 type:complete len:622 (+) Transcript_16349:336-2201(+)
MPLSARIVRGLQDSGLELYAPRFAALSDADFLTMLMSDYARYGVVDVEDKQRLFRLLKALNEEVRNRSRGGGGQRAVTNELLDLDAHDGDLLAHACGPAMQLSPMQEVRAVAEAVEEPDTPADPPKIRVVVRKRPLNKKEKDKGEDDIVDANMQRAYVVVNEVKVKVDLTKYIDRHQFNFDDALDDSVSNEDVYNVTVKPLVHTLFANGKASCFAYGQTGSGKTYTMNPLPIRSAADIMQYLALPKYQHLNLYVSCFEIYGNKVFDLLNARKKLNILEDGKKRVVVVGLKEYNVASVEKLKSLINQGAGQRSTGSTGANADSSRSHSIMQFALKEGGEDGKLASKISFIDLAGSERGADTFDNDRQTRLEGAEINKSLLALKECIRALDSDARHVPFRGSKLTAVLRDSFVGATARTVMIANISPNSASVEHTLNTLRYADRVKELRKDKAQRDPGGVTPGEDPNYYAAVARADEEAEAVKKPSKPILRAGGGQRAGGPNKVTDSAANGGGRGSPGGSDEDEILSEHNKMLDTILEEEELLITAHRMHIEETMELVRSEMNLLTEVDQPGSAIDQYVNRLDKILKQKLEGVAMLQAKLERFKGHLQKEEMITTTMRPNKKR